MEKQVTGKVMELDVREDLKNKLEPFDKIMEAIKTCESGDTFILHAPFKPLPLLPIMKKKGFMFECEMLEKKYWKITFVRG